MSAYGTPGYSGTTYATTSGTTKANRERTLSMIGGLLGLVMFGLGFAKWLNVGDGKSEHAFSGFAFNMPTTPIIGFSVAAGLVAVLGAAERRRGRGVPSAIPTGLAATSFVLALGVLLGKGQVEPTGGATVDAEIGLILGLVVSLVQTFVLSAVLASRYDNDVDTDLPYGAETTTPVVRNTRTSL